MVSITNIFIPVWIPIWDCSYLLKSIEDVVAWNLPYEQRIRFYDTYWRAKSNLSADKYPIFYRTCSSFITRFQSRPKSSSAHDEALGSRMHAISDWLKMADSFHPAKPASKLCSLGKRSEPSPLACFSRVYFSRYPPNGELTRRLNSAHA